MGLLFRVKTTLMHTAMQYNIQYTNSTHSVRMTSRQPHANIAKHF